MHLLLKTNVKETFFRSNCVEMGVKGRCDGLGRRQGLQYCNIKLVSIEKSIVKLFTSEKAL